MDIIEALKQEESKLHQQLKRIQGAIAALNGRAEILVSPQHATITKGTGGKRTLSAAGRARIVRAAKARWAKIRAEKAK